MADTGTRERISDARHKAESAIKHEHESSRQMLISKMDKMDDLTKRSNEIQYTCKPALQMEKQQLIREKEDFAKLLEQQQNDESKRKERENELDKQENQIKEQQFLTENEIQDLKRTNDLLDSERGDLERQIKSEEDNIQLKQVEIRNKLTFSYDHRYSLKSNEYESSISILQSSIEKSKTYDVETAKIQSEVDDLLILLRDSIALSKDETTILLKTKQTILDQMDEDLLKSTSEVDKLVETVKAEEEEKLAKELSEIQRYHDTELRKTILDLESIIESLNQANQNHVRNLKDYELCIDEYKKYFEKLKKSRYSLFHNFELHLGDWKSFIESNIKAMKKQYQQVLLTNIDLWSRQGYYEGGKQLAETLTSDIIHEINLISKSSKLVYPEFSTTISREIEFNDEEISTSFSQSYTAIVNQHLNQSALFASHYDQIPPYASPYPFTNTSTQYLQTSPKRVIRHSPTKTTKILKLSRMLTSTHAVVQPSVSMVSNEAFGLRQQGTKSPERFQSPTSFRPGSARIRKPRPQSAHKPSVTEPLLLPDILASSDAATKKWPTEYTEKFGPNLIPKPTIIQSSMKGQSATIPKPSTQTQKGRSGNTRPTVRPQSAGRLRSTKNVTFSGVSQMWDTIEKSVSHR